MSSNFNASLMSFFLVTPFVARACSRFNHESVGEKCTANSWTRKLSGENAMVAYPGLETNLAHVEVLAVHRRHQVGIHDLPGVLRLPQPERLRKEVSAQRGCHSVRHAVPRSSGKRWPGLSSPLMRSFPL